MKLNELTAAEAVGIAIDAVCDTFRWIGRIFYCAYLFISGALDHLLESVDQIGE